METDKEPTAQATATTEVCLPKTSISKPLPSSAKSSEPTPSRDVYRIVDAKCKFCGSELRLKIHEDYDVSDPHKLLSMSACNPCADLRERRRILHLRFSSISSGILNLQERSRRSMGDKERKEVEALVEESRHNIELLIKLYLRLIGDWYQRNDIVFEDSMVEPFIQAPAALSKHIARLWRAVPLQTELLAP